MTVTFDALRQKPYQGVVESIAMVSQAGSSGTVNYTVTVRLTHPDPAVLPGMTAVALIETAHLENVLLVPLQSVVTLNGRQVVFVMRPGQPDPRPAPVNLGAQSSSYGELQGSFLKAGDQVVVDPSKLTGVQAAAGNRFFLFGGGGRPGGPGGGRPGGGGGGRGPGD